MSDSLYFAPLWSGVLFVVLVFNENVDKKTAISINS